MSLTAPSISCIICPEVYLLVAICFSHVLDNDANTFLIIHRVKIKTFARVYSKGYRRQAHQAVVLKQQGGLVGKVVETLGRT